MGGVTKTLSGVGSSIGGIGGQALGGFGLLGGDGPGQQEQQNARLSQMIAELDPGARPEYAQYQGLRDASGNLQSQYKLSNGDDYSKGMLGKQALEEAGLRDQAAQSQAGALANARSQLASQYGLRGGAANRLAQMGQRDLLNANQKVSQQGALARSDIANQQFGLGREAEKFNIGQSTTDQNQMNQAKLAEYQEKMKAYSAAKQAQATLGAGIGSQKGGVIGGVNKSLGK